MIYLYNAFMKKLKINITVMTVIVFLAGASRIFPHPPNFSPILAIALFGAAHFSKKWQAVFIPMFAVWLSDLFINNFVYSNQGTEFIWFYSGFYWQYASYFIIIMSSILVFKNKISISKTLGASLGSSMAFFLLSNFGVWAGSGMYMKNLSGLITCYVAGLPFLQNTIVSNVLFTTVLFGSYYLIQVQYSSLKNENLLYS